MSLEKDDKIALSVLIALGVVFTLVILFVIRWFFASVMGIIDLDTGGVGWRSAFVVAIILSFLFIFIFALVAGDGVIGELGIMVVSFFVMVLFFTVSIAVVL